MDENEGNDKAIDNDIENIEETKFDTDDVLNESLHSDPDIQKDNSDEIDDLKNLFEDAENSPGTIAISEEHVEPLVVPVKKSGKIKMSTVLMVLLSVVLIGGSAYTIGYFNGQINLNDAEINEKVEALLESNYKSEIYKSVKEYIEESGINSSISETDVTEIFKNVSNSIVGITSKTYIYDWFNSQQESQVTGSGVIFDQTPDLLYVVTNYHVISDATDVIVEIAKDQIVNSKVVGFDESTDLAVLAVQKKDIDADLLKEIKPISIGDSEKIQIGEIAIAIGNPLGYNNTVTQGIISAVDRQVDEDTTVMYIQTDAAINPGNSGGALVNSKGELIGINSAKIAETDVEGMGFAIPTEKMMTIVTELMANGYVSRPYIGIGGVDIDESTAKLYDIPMGVLVRYVYENSPAQTAGVKVTDLVIGINDENVYNMSDLTSILSKYKPGDTIQLKIVRDEKTEMVIPVVLGNKGDQK